MEKRAINEIVTTVLITLLVISLVAIVFSFVRAPVQSTGTSLTGSQACLRTDIQAVYCNRTTGNVIYKWAGGDTTLWSVKISVKRQDGSSVAGEGAAPSLLATQSAIAPGVSAANNGTEATVAAVIQVSGQNFTCGESPVKVTCTG